MKIKLRGLRFRLPLKAIGSVLNNIVTTLLVATALAGFALAFVSPVQYISTYLPLYIGTLSITESLVATNVALLQNNFELTLGSSAGIYSKPPSYT